MASKSELISARLSPTGTERRYRTIGESTLGLVVRIKDGEVQVENTCDGRPLHLIPNLRMTPADALHIAGLIKRAAEKLQASAKARQARPRAAARPLSRPSSSSSRGRGRR